MSWNWQSLVNKKYNVGLHISLIGKYRKWGNMKVAGFFQEQGGIELGFKMAGYQKGV